MGKTTAFAYTTALNNYLARVLRPTHAGGRCLHYLLVANAPVRWKIDIVDFFGEPPKDDPDRNVRAVASLFSIRSHRNVFAR